MISFKGDRNDAMFSKENTCYSLNYVTHTCHLSRDIPFFIFSTLKSYISFSQKSASKLYLHRLFLPVQNIFFYFFFFNTIRGDNGYIIYILLVPLQCLFLMPNIRSTEFKSIVHSILDFYLIYYTGINNAFPLKWSINVRTWHIYILSQWGGCCDAKFLRLLPIIPLHTR